MIKLLFLVVIAVVILEIGCRRSISHQAGGGPMERPSSSLSNDITSINSNSIIILVTMLIINSSRNNNDDDNDSSDNNDTSSLTCLRKGHRALALTVPLRISCFLLIFFEYTFSSFVKEEGAVSPGALDADRYKLRQLQSPNLKDHWLVRVSLESVVWHGEVFNILKAFPGWWNFVPLASVATPSGTLLRDACSGANACWTANLSPWERRSCQCSR